MKKNIVWTIAGSDASACAGIQVDLKTFHHLGVHACSIITAITAQNNQSINKIHYASADMITAQIQCLEKDFMPQAIKISLLGQKDSIKKIIDFLRGYSGRVVLDPLMISTSGQHLFEGDLTRYLLHLKTIFPLIDLITPNLYEAEKLVSHTIQSHQDIEKAAKTMLSLGVRSVLIKGGHHKENVFSQDYWTNGVDSFWLSMKRYPKKHYRGTGCALSSAITACLALGHDIRDALVIAKMYVSRGIRLSEDLWPHHALLAHLALPEEESDLPYLTHHPLHQPPEPFIDCGKGPLGLYPVIDSVYWVKKLLPLGVKTLQLRIKNKHGAELENEVKESIHLAKHYQAKLFINDHWQLAMHFGAYGVHLGQGDLNTADINRIREAGLRLGISTHCYHEIARAHACSPSYLACGPVFPTESKAMLFAPLGLHQLNRWRNMLRYPLVAIGGINNEKIDGVLKTKVAGVAMISAITKAKDPQAITKTLLNKVNKHAARTR